MGKLEFALNEFKNITNSYDTKLMHLLNYNKGNIYFKLRNYLLASQYFRNALYFDPNDKDTKENLELAIYKIKSSIQNFNDNLNDYSEINEDDIKNSKEIFDIVESNEKEFVFNTSIREDGEYDW